MSFAYSNAVWNGYPDITGGKLLVLLSLCDRANEGGVCFPSVEDISRRCRLCDRQVQRHLKALEKEDKLISKDSQKGRNGVNVYTMTFPPEGVTPVTPRGDSGVVQGVTPMTPKPSFNHQRTYNNYERTKSARNHPRTDTERKLAKAF